MLSRFCNVSTLPAFLRQVEEPPVGGNIGDMLQV